ncbi:MAG: HRDC domain-containing protein [Tannerella sp.]|jgi:MoxR-like ATPase|nr:HRDC domain-containing protein [Tannerella sp.]
MQTNPQLQLAEKYVNFTGKNIFLTGKAGTGKTTFLHHLKETVKKRMIVVAPTGVAAINARGVTIHSFFQLPFGPLVGVERMEESRKKLFNRNKINIIRSLDLLVIDEISMVRADMLDAIDYVLKRYRNRRKPFGGVQLLMIGDLQQLSPVVKNDENALLRQYYETPYFFSSKALKETSFVTIELKEVFRQQDEYFLRILNKVRDNDLDTATLAELNKRHLPHFEPKEEDGFITLCTHNINAQNINEKKLCNLSGREFVFKAEIQGKFPEYNYPTEYKLVLKENAQVMFVKNDPAPQKLFFNGKIGRITCIEHSGIFVQCPDDEQEIFVEPLEWENLSYTLNKETDEISEVVEGKFKQFPLKLAWAITIHKSQGLTFERAIIDAQHSFAHGQVYVALSRCKTLNGIILKNPVSRYAIITDNTVKDFTNDIEQNPVTESKFNADKISYQKDVLMDLFDFYPIFYKILNIYNFICENPGSFLSPTKDKFDSMVCHVRTEINEVAEKFKIQIAALMQKEQNIEHNAQLQNRIGKASSYFSEKIQSLISDNLNSAHTDIDNKELKKKISDMTKKLKDDLKIKKQSLQSAREGFFLDSLLKAKALATIEKETEKETDKKHNEIRNDEIRYPELFNHLKEWRAQRAMEMGRPAFFIFSQKTLYELVNYLPATVADLNKINGFGKTKIETFGDDILKIINSFSKK